MDDITRVTQAHRKTTVPSFGPGDQVRVWYRIIEADRVRQAPFEGIVIRRRGSGLSETCTVRRITHGEGVERVFPIHAPVVDRIEVIRRGNVRRARLYFLRRKIGKTRMASGQAEDVAADNPAERQGAAPTASDPNAAANQPVGSDAPKP